MGDMNHGRVYRIAPAGASYEISFPDFSTAETAVEALQNANMDVQYRALDNSPRNGKEAEPALLELWKADIPVLGPGLFGCWPNLKARVKKYIFKALKDSNSDIRLTGLRVARHSEEDIIPYVKKLVKDSSPQGIFGLLIFRMGS